MIGNGLWPAMTNHSRPRILLLLVSLILSASSSAAALLQTVPNVIHRATSQSRHHSNLRLKGGTSDNSGSDDGIGEHSNNNSQNSNNDDASSSSSFAQSLSERIAQVEQSESSFVAGLQRRVQSVAQAEEFDSVLSPTNNSNQENTPVVVELPVVCLDALLPNQRLTGSTTDPTFCNLLRSIGLGGAFVMTSLNNRQRKVRRFGVVARIELVDVDGDDDNNNDDEKEQSEAAQEDDSFSHYLLSSPTSVTFSIVGKRCCEILGPAEGMKQRIGRWRRGYDPDGEESRLGWGEERFVNGSTDTEERELLSSEMDSERNIISGSTQKSAGTQWGTNKILILPEDEDEATSTTDSIAKATYLIPLIQQWLALASDQTTYDNIDVIAATRRKSGEPGLSINASALLRKVQHELGPMPSPQHPVALALWGAALINPLPALGVATEIRGAVLEAEGADRKLSVLERGLVKSIDNLDGTRPLNM